MQEAHMNYPTSNPCARDATVRLATTIGGTRTNHTHDKGCITSTTMHKYAAMTTTIRGQKFN
jgi:hypothetical protein